MYKTGVSKAEYLVHNAYGIGEVHVESFVVCVVGKMAQGVGMVRKCCGVIPI